MNPVVGQFRGGKLSLNRRNIGVGKMIFTAWNNGIRIESVQNKMRTLI